MDEEHDVQTDLSAEVEVSDSPRLTKRQIRRLSLLADVAEMYFVKKLSQKAISEKIGTTPSNVSRMISDAEKHGVVQITIHRPMSNDRMLGEQLKERLGLTDARVVIADERDAHHVSRQVAHAGADMLRSVLNSGMNIGITWGKTLLAVVDSFGDPIQIGGQVIQLAGSIGAVEKEFDSVSLVRRLAQLTKSVPIHLSSPFVVENQQIAESLRRNASNRQGHQLASACDVVVVGVGSIARDQSSLFASGFLSSSQIEEILGDGAVGEVCGHPIDQNGAPVAPDFSSRVVTIGLDDLQRTPIKLAVVARPHLARPILASALAGYISHLVVDVGTAKEILALSAGTASS